MVRESLDRLRDSGRRPEPVDLTPALEIGRGKIPAYQMDGWLKALKFNLQQCVAMLEELGV